MIVATILLLSLLAVLPGLILLQYGKKPYEEQHDLSMPKSYHERNVEPERER